MKYSLMRQLLCLSFIVLLNGCAAVSVNYTAPSSYWDVLKIEVPTDSRVTTNITLDAAIKYKLTVRVAEQVIDGSISKSQPPRLAAIACKNLNQDTEETSAIDELGFCNACMNYLNNWKVQPEAEWFELLIVLDNSTMIPISKLSCTDCAKREYVISGVSGKLAMLVNDAEKWYFNNKGILEVTIKKMESGET